MKRKILLMAILSMSVLPGCRIGMDCHTDENIFIKNTTERTIDYLYEVSPAGDECIFKAQGKTISWVAENLLPGEEKRLYGVALTDPAPNDLSVLMSFKFQMRIPDGEQWFYAELMSGKAKTEDRLIIEITEEMIQKMKTVKPFMAISDKASLQAKGVAADKSNLTGNEFELGPWPMTVWDYWSSENEFPVQTAEKNKILKEIMDYERKKGITEFSYIYQDIVYTMSLQDGKRTRIGAVTEAEKNQGVK